MVDPDGVENEPEQLAGGDSSRVQWAAVAVVVVLIAAGVLLARAGHHDARPSAAHRETVPPAPAPTAAAASREVHVGSVYLEHMAQCTNTNHHHSLSVALRVINLSARPLDLLDASAVTSDSLLVQPRSVQVGVHGCGGTPRATPMRLQSGEAAVVSMVFRVGAFCPRQASVSARVSFDGGSEGVVHADSAQLANLSHLDFVQCT